MKITILRFEVDSALRYLVQLREIVTITILFHINLRQESTQTSSAKENSHLTSFHKFILHVFLIVERLETRPTTLIFPIYLARHYEDTKNRVFIYGCVCQNSCNIPSEVTAGLRRGQKVSVSVCVCVQQKNVRGPLPISLLGKEGQTGGERR